jgi:hypothetical protein
MITTGSKWFYGFGFVTLALATVYGWTTGGSGLGPLTLGYKGGVGDHFGYGILVAGGLVALVFGLVSTAARDADAEAVAEVAGTATVPAVTPAGASYWPAIAGFGVALLVIGLVAEPLMFVFGLVVLGIVLVEWAVQSWADRATGDVETNRRIRNRLMNPIEYPAAAALSLAVIAVAFSRVFLAISADAAVWVALAVGVIVVVGGFLIASRPRLSPNVIVGLLVLVAVAIIGVGVAGAIAGTREFHPHEDEGEGHAEEGALAPASAVRLASPVVVEVAP